MLLPLDALEKQVATDIFDIGLRRAQKRLKTRTGYELPYFSLAIDWATGDEVRQTWGALDTSLLVSIQRTRGHLSGFLSVAIETMSAKQLLKILHAEERRGNVGLFERGIFREIASNLGNWVIYSFSQGLGLSSQTERIDVEEIASEDLSKLKLGLEYTLLGQFSVIQIGAPVECYLGWSLDRESAVRFRTSLAQNVAPLVETFGGGY